MNDGPFMFGVVEIGVDMLMERKEFYTCTEPFGASFDFMTNVSSHYSSIFEASLSSFTDCLGPFRSYFDQQFQLPYQGHLRSLDHWHTLSSDGHQ